MKTIEIKNRDLSNVYDTLDRMGVSSYKTKRGKGKLQRNIKKKFEEYAEDLKDIQSEYFQKDEEGNFKQEPNNQGALAFVWLDKCVEHPELKKEANEAMQELFEEIAVIDIVEHETKIKAFFDAVQEDEFTTKDGFKDEAFDLLMDELEQTFEEEE